MDYILSVAHDPDRQFGAAVMQSVVDIFDEYECVCDSFAVEIPYFDETEIEFHTLSKLGQGLSLKQSMAMLDALCGSLAGVLLPLGLCNSYILSLVVGDGEEPIIIDRRDLYGVDA